MRLNEGDKVVGIAAFRAGLAEQRGIGTMTLPPAGAPPDGGERVRDRVEAAGTRAASRRRPCTRISSTIYTGNANPDLAARSAATWASSSGQAEVFEFANENIFVKILDNVREKDVFLVQPTCHPVNKSIMELLIMIDAFKRASAGRITAVVPYYALRPLRQEGPAARARSRRASSPT